MSSPALFTIMRDGLTVKTFPVQGDVLLGRADECDVRLDDRAISRQHAIFRLMGAEVQVEKKSEFAPLVVNGSECTSAVLKEGDVISLGPYFIRLSAPVDQVPQVSRTTPVEELPPAEIPDTAVIDLTKSLVGDPNLQPSDFLDAVPGEAKSKANEPEDLSGVAGGSMDAAIQLGDPVPPPEEAPLADPEPSLGLATAQEADANIEMDDGSSGEPVDEDGKTKVAPLAKVSVTLVFKPGTANVTTYELTQDEVTVGRGKNCTIVLNDKKCSRKNAVIRRNGLKFVIKDLNSANGTYVNGSKIDEHELSGEDVIRIGNVEFQFKAESSDYAAQEKGFMSLPEEIPDPSGDPFGMAEVPAAVDSGVPAEAPASPPVGQAVPHADGMSNIPGITGLGGPSGRKLTLIERFKALPKRTQGIAAVAGVLFAMWLMEDDAPVVKKANDKKPGPVASAVATGPATFESLSPEKKTFIEAQHNMAFDYYKNKDYDKALFEIEKIFSIIPDYKDSREIQRYAREGKRKMEALEEERRKKEDEAKLKAKIAQLMDEAKTRMAKKEYDQAKELFSELLALDPDNSSVSNWRKEIENYEEQMRIQAQQAQVEIEINKRAWSIYKDGMEMMKDKKYHGAIDIFQKAIDVGASDKKAANLSKKMIAACHAKIRRMRDPILKDAKRREIAGEFTKAFNLFKKATKVDPPHPAGYAGMSRIRTVLHERARAIYTEAVLAESYSDFTSAKRMFEECLNTAPHDDIYYDRAQRRLNYYFRKDDGGQQHE